MDEAVPNTTAAAKNRSVEIRPKETSLADAADQSKDDGLSRSAAVLMFVFLSGALAALFPVVLWCSRGDALLAMWRLSLLLCSYFYFAACALSADSAGTKALLFFQVLCVALCAFVVDAFLNQIAGMAIIYFVSVVMAGVFGHALAEHRESDGAETAAFAAATKAVAFPNGMVARAPMSSRKVMFFVVGAAFVPVCAGGAKWLMECQRHGCTVAELGPGMFLFMVISFSLLFGIYLELEPLHVDILGIDCGMVFLGGLFVIIALLVISFHLFGEVGETVTLWIFLLGLAVFFGHCVRVHDSYVKIMRSHIRAVMMKEINAARFENGRDEIELGLTYAPTFF